QRALGAAPRPFARRGAGAVRRAAAPGARVRAGDGEAHRGRQRRRRQVAGGGDGARAVSAQAGAAPRRVRCAGCGNLSRLSLAEAGVIAHLRGTLADKSIDHVVVEVGGVGLRVTVSLQTLAELPAPGAPVQLLTHMIVREDALTLYGFLTPEERS